MYPPYTDTQTLTDTDTHTHTHMPILAYGHIPSSSGECMCKSAVDSKTFNTNFIHQIAYIIIIIIIMYVSIHSSNDYPGRVRMLFAMNGVI